MNYGAVEAGGTKMCCCVGDENGNIIKECVIATGSPSDTLDGIAEFFIGYCHENGICLDGIGLGWFGPINIDISSDDYGRIGNSPKVEWCGVNVISEIKKRLNGLCEDIYVTTDVNASLIGECWLGQGKSLHDVCYITVGTGIGAGIMAGGKIVGGFSHPEFGHIGVTRVAGDKYVGCCPSHSCCFEGMASGPSMELRWGVPASKLPDDHIGWDYEADYIASAIVNLIFTLCPEKIILGGGVMQHPGLVSKITDKVQNKIAGYIDLSAAGGVSNIVVMESLGGNQGMLGCIKLAMGN